MPCHFHSPRRAGRLRKRCGGERQRTSTRRLALRYLTCQPTRRAAPSVWDPLATAADIFGDHLTHRHLVVNPQFQVAEIHTTRVGVIEPLPLPRRNTSKRRSSGSSRSILHMLHPQLVKSGLQPIRRLRHLITFSQGPSCRPPGHPAIVLPPVPACCPRSTRPAPRAASPSGSATSAPPAHRLPATACLLLTHRSHPRLGQPLFHQRHERYRRQWWRR